MRAAQAGHVDVVKLLVDSAANVNLADLVASPVQRTTMRKANRCAVADSSCLLYLDVHSDLAQAAAASILYLFHVHPWNSSCAWRASHNRSLKGMWLSQHSYVINTDHDVIKTGFLCRRRALQLRHTCLRGRPTKYCPAGSNLLCPRTCFPQDDFGFQTHNNNSFTQRGVTKQSMFYHKLPNLAWFLFSHCCVPRVLRLERRAGEPPSTSQETVRPLATRLRRSSCRHPRLQPVSPPPSPQLPPLDSLHRSLDAGATA